MTKTAQILEKFWTRPSMRWLGTLVVALLVMACGSPYMQKVAAPQAYEPGSDTAVVLFIRPSGLAPASVATITDSDNRFLGDSLAHSHFGVEVDPGEHLFVVWGETTNALKATVEAGRVYYVNVDTQMGVLTPRYQLLALKPGGANWDKVAEWLSSTDQLRRDDQAARSFEQTKGSEIVERSASAQQNYASYSEEERAERTLVSKDGLRTEQSRAAHLPPSEPAPPASPPPPQQAALPASAEAGGGTPAVRARPAAGEDAPQTPTDRADPAPRQACVPGSTQACVGPGACQGGQACSPDGSTWQLCDCGDD